MAWIKRNLSLVISGVVALALLGVGGWYLWSAIQKDKQVDTDINQIKSEIEGLLGKQPTPNAQNLADAKRQLERLSTFMVTAKKQFPPTPPPAQPLDNQSFKSLLQTTVDELHKQASSVGIHVETNYYFTFENERLPVMFPPETLRPLSERLSEVKMLASILFKARVNRLAGIRRAMVPGERAIPASPAAANDYLPVPARANADTGMTLWPYEVTFNCFSPELASVLDSLQRVEYGLVVKSISSEAVGEGAKNAPRNPPGGRPPAGRTNAAPKSLETIIDERPLRVTLRIEVIKPSPPQR
jgi:hypothetical protein